MSNVYKYRCRNSSCPQKEVEVTLEYAPGEYRTIKGKSPTCEACGDGLWYIHPKSEKARI